MKKIYLILLVAAFSMSSFAAIGPIVDNLYIVGDGSPAGWNLGSQYAIMKVAEGEFTWTGKLTANNRFKFRTVAGDWWPGICPPGPAKTQLVPIGTTVNLDYFANQPQGDPGYAVAETGDYSIHIDLMEYQMTVVKVEIPKPSTDKLFLVGGATTAKWNNKEAIAFNKIADGVFFWTGPLTTADSGDFKFISEAGTWAKTINPKGDDVTLTGKSRQNLKYRPLESDAGDSKFRVTEDGDYTIQVDVNNLFMTYSQMNFDLMYIVGNAVSGKNAAWSVGDAIEMTKVASGVFTWSGILHPSVNSPGFKLLNGTKAWDSSLVYNQGVAGNKAVELGMSYPITYLVGGNDNKFFVAEAGAYAIEVDINTMMIKFASPTGIASNRTSSFTVQGVNSSIVVRGSDTDAYDAKLYDVTGKYIAQVTNVSGSVTLGNHFSTGIYIVRIDSTKEQVTFKVAMR